VHQTTEGNHAGAAVGKLSHLLLGSIVPSPFQPRKVFDKATLVELADSILRHGLQQPIVVRPIEGERFELIIGERRWRAAQLAGLGTILARVVTTEDLEAQELALVENVCRQDLDAIEEGEAYEALMARGATLEQVAARVSKDPQHVKWCLTFLRLKPQYREALRQGIISRPVAYDIARVPAPLQWRVWRAVLDGVNTNELTRLASALSETEKTTQMFEDPATQAKGKAAHERLRHLLDGLGGKIAAAYSKADLQVLEWVADGTTTANLERVSLAIRQLRQLEDAMKRAMARKRALEAAGMPPASSHPEGKGR